MVYAFARAIASNTLNRPSVFTRSTIGACCATTRFFTVRPSPSSIAGTNVRIHTVIARPISRAFFPRAIINVVLAICSIPSSIARARVRVDSVHAHTVPTILPVAIRDVVLAICTIPSGSARARVRVDSVHAHTVPTVLPRAVVNVTFWPGLGEP